MKHNNYLILSFSLSLLLLVGCKVKVDNPDEALRAKLHGAWLLTDITKDGVNVFDSLEFAQVAVFDQEGRFYNLEDVLGFEKNGVFYYEDMPVYRNDTIQQYFTLSKGDVCGYNVRDSILRADGEVNVRFTYLRDPMIRFSDAATLYMADKTHAVTATWTRLQRIEGNYVRDTTLDIMSIELSSLDNTAERCWYYFVGGYLHEGEFPNPAAVTQSTLEHYWGTEQALVSMMQDLSRDYIDNLGAQFTVADYIPCFADTEDECGQRPGWREKR